nr:unnamed protein product [Callosobruchus analis]
MEKNIWSSSRIDISQ